MVLSTAQYSLYINRWADTASYNAWLLAGRPEPVALAVAPAAPAARAVPTATASAAPAAAGAQLAVRQAKSEREASMNYGYGDGSVQAAPVSAGAVIVLFTTLKSIVGAVLWPAVRAAARMLLSGAKRAVVLVDKLPPALRTAVIATAGTVAAVELVDDDEEVLGIAPFSGGGLAPVEVTVVGTWVANGVTFYRLADGRFAVQNSKGRWKVWRAKKPIVIMPTGMSNLRSLLRADAVLNKQAARLRRLIDRRTKAKTRRSGRDFGLPSIVKTEVR